LISYGKWLQRVNRDEENDRSPKVFLGLNLTYGNRILVRIITVPPQAQNRNSPFISI